ncbi:MAG: PqqD family protein [Candidatus Promineifilaceae bacterium]
MNISKMYPKPHPQTAGRIIDGEAVLILADSSEVNVLNQVGSRIFELSNGNNTVEEISETISDEYEISREQADADVREFLLQLVDQSVIVLGDTEEDE